MDRAVRDHLQIGRPGLAERWAELAAGGGSMGAIDRVRERHGAEVARFVSLQLELERRSDGPRFRTSKGSEQATHARVSEHRAEAFASRCSDGTTVWDATCGIGADSLALARRVPNLVAGDLDGASTWCAAANLTFEAESSGDVRARWAVARADATRPPFLDGSNVLGLFDPDRRTEGARTLDPELWSPTLSATLRVAESLAGAQVKLAPSTDPTLVEGRDGRSLEWVSVDGEMKELTLATGALSRGERCATALRSDSRSAAFASAPAPLREAIGAAGVRAGAWLVELDVAVWSAGLEGPLATELEASPIDASVARGYLIAAAPPPDRFDGLARSWRVLDSTTADRKKVRQMLRAHEVGPLTVKKRNHPETAEALARRFAGSGNRPGRLAVMRTEGDSVAILLQEP